MGVSPRSTQARPAKVTPEGKVKTWVKKALKALNDEKGYKVYSFWPVQTGMGAATLDSLHSINGHFVSIETKAEGKVMTPRQFQTATDMCTAGAQVYVVDSKATLAKVMGLIRHQCRL